jgi:hypothetical protein
MDAFRNRITICIRRQWIAAGIGAFALATSVFAARASTASPYATQLINENAAFGAVALYNDPNSVLGEPTRRAINNDPLLGNSPFYVSIVSAAYNREYLTNNKVLTRFDRKSDGAGGFIYGSVTVKFDHPVVDDPANPYGIDLNIFGNAFYHASGFPNDTTDFRSSSLIGGIFDEPLVISVSPDNVNWYTYGSGPYGDTAFPTQGYEWSGAQFDATGNGWKTQATDFTKPVNPTLNSVLGVDGQVAADVMTTYVGSGGGTGVDLAESGFDWIQYVRVNSTSASYGGEIDGFADVRPMRVGDALSITPANVASGTPLFFQSAGDESRTAVLAHFSSVSGLAKLNTSAVTDAAAIAALAGSDVLATYQLDVLPLVGTAMVSFAADYELMPGDEFAGDGANLELVEWNGEEWNSIEFNYDSVTGRLQLDDWTDPAATFAILETEVSGPNGDYNEDGQVDAADYVVWRKGTGLPSTEPYYNAWRGNFGTTIGGGGASIDQSSVPEPAATSMAVFAVTATLCAGQCRNPRQSRGLRANSKSVRSLGR